jgi:hypothetical protein
MISENISTYLGRYHVILEQITKKRFVTTLAVSVCLFPHESLHDGLSMTKRVLNTSILIILYFVLNPNLFARTFFFLPWYLKQIFTNGLLSISGKCNANIGVKAVEA